jgi:uncharacterized phage infection (PIP) family protein YhgE
MDHLKLDLDRLKTLNSDLDAIYKEFTGADDFSDTVATATGHNGLAGAVHDFAHAWNEKRPQMQDGVHKMQQKLSTVTDGFTKVDSQLANAMDQLIQQEDQAAAKAKHDAPAQPASHSSSKAN